MNSSDHSTRRRQQQQRRPKTIGELSERALDNLYDETKPLKYFLRVAEKYRKDGRDYHSKGDLENAFIHFARAATLVLDKLPTHREYYTLLTSTQRSNLNLNGTEILEELGNLKRKLSRRYEDWMRDHPDSEQPEPPPATAPIPERQQDQDLTLRRTRSKGKERDRVRHDHHRLIHEYRQDDYDADDVDVLADRERRRHRDQGSTRERGVFVTSPQPSPTTRQAKKEAAASAARQAASAAPPPESLDYTFSRPPLRTQNGQAHVPNHSDGPDDERRRYAEGERQYLYEQQQKEMRHREEEIMRKREETRKRKEEEEGIYRRQQEANEAARVARSDPHSITNGSGPRASVLSAQGSVLSIASTSSAASPAPSALFPHPSASSSVATTPSSFYQNSTSTMVPQHPSSSYYTQPSSQAKVSPPSASYYAPGSSSHQPRVSPPAPSAYYGPPSSTQPRISPSPSPSYYVHGSSSTQVVMPPPPPSASYYGSSSTQAVVPGSSSSFYAQPSSSSHATLSQPSYPNPGSSLTTVSYTNTSRTPNPLPRPPAEHAPHPVPSKPEPHTQAPQQVHTQTAGRPNSFIEGGPTMLPLEPARFEADSTDSESVHSLNIHRGGSRFSERPDEHRTPTRRKTRSPSPFTTTSPSPPDMGKVVDQLMTQHQRSQGYYPSTSSMFSTNGSPIGYPLLPQGTGGRSALLYGSASEMLHQQHHSNSAVISYPYQVQRPSPPDSSAPMPPGASSQLRTNYRATTSGPAYSAAAITPQVPRPQSRSQPHLHPPYPNETQQLKTVTLPKECLPKFLGIARANTSMNRETCGLLLGRDKGNKYMVTTLLIPKQHSTSDTCTMDEEELVLEFTEERSLITLGWIHTHPSQSCFMSSVDLHTHSGFQRMLPESFAVVCAPKSKPNFGIFRLTDPPGLSTILNCKATEAFHPHPDLPIYTDADKGHVQMKDGPLEIVDLR